MDTNNYNRQTLIGVFVSDQWADYGFKKGDLLEVGYHNEEGECVEESSEYMWCKTWGTWNPTESDYMTEDHLVVLGRTLDWRSSLYENIPPEIKQKACEIISSLE